MSNFEFGEMSKPRMESLNHTGVLLVIKFCLFFSEGNRFTNDATIARFVARNSPKRAELLGNDLIEESQIETFISLFEEYFDTSEILSKVLEIVKKNLEKSLFLVKNRLTVADLLLWRIVSENEEASYFFSFIFQFHF